MTAEHIKTKVKEAFDKVESSAFLQEQIRAGVLKHKANYEIFKTQNPGLDFEFWKIQQQEINFNSTNNEEIMAMGIFLLSLDEFSKNF